jgi:ankyrin repeat protein
VEILLEFGANPNLQDFEGATPLHIAGDENSPEIVTLLVQKGANPAIRNDFGTKAADLCINRGLGGALLVTTTATPRKDVIIIPV